MSAAARLLLQLEQRAVTAENLIVSLKNELAQLELNGHVSKANDITTLKHQNEKLKIELDGWRKKLVDVGISCGIQNLSTTATPSVANKPIAVSIVVPDNKTKETKKSQPKKIPENSNGAAPKVEDDGPVDIGRIDLRVGKIVGVKKHPDADSLYVEEVDLGEGKNRTIVSGLVKFVPIEEMENRFCIFMCNLKPAKMRGITSEGMLMCASTPEKVEILLPPSGSVAGDLVEVEGYTRRPDPILNPKKKIWETVAPDLKTDSNRLATYKGKVLKTIKGPISASTLSNVQIK